MRINESGRSYMPICEKKCYRRAISTYSCQHFLITLYAAEIESKRIILIRYSAFADTGLPLKITNAGRAGAERREIKKEYEKHL